MNKELIKKWIAELKKEVEEHEDYTQRLKTRNEAKVDYLEETLED
jgi:hypothetical protein